jgi:hypothetical protein
MFNKMFNHAPEAKKREKKIGKNLRNVFYGSMLCASFLSACNSNSEENKIDKHSFTQIEQVDSEMTKQQFTEIKKIDNKVDYLASELFKQIKEKNLADSTTYKYWVDINGNLTKKEKVYHYGNWSFSGKDKSSRNPQEVKDADLNVVWKSKKEKEGFLKEGYEYQLSGTQVNDDPVQSTGQIIHIKNPVMKKGSAQFLDYSYYFNQENGKGTIYENNFYLNSPKSETRENFTKYEKITSVFNNFKKKIQEELTKLEKNQ